MVESARLDLPAITLDSLLGRTIESPDLVLLRRRKAPDETPLDVRALVAASLGSSLGRIREGDSVAVGVGSRGISRLPEIVAAVVTVLEGHGAHPFIVPAMGSHGSATAQGQRAVLADLGITEESHGVAIRASMNTTVVGEVDGLVVHCSDEALGADHVMVLNRLKSHTSFSGAIESGVAKMLAIGLGKQRGAEELHRLGPLHLERRILAACSALTSALPVLGGLAVVEDQDKALLAIEFLEGDEIGGPRESALLDRARTHEARLPFDEVDVLIVDTMGKEISGTGMDTNVVGRRMVRGSPEPSGVSITNVVVLSVSPGSEGNAIGMGLADFMPVAALERVDLRATYANALTAGLQGVQRAQVPIVLASDRDAVHAAILAAGLPDPRQARVVRIRSTLALSELMVTPNLVEAAAGYESVAGHESGQLFDIDGAARPWPQPAPHHSKDLP